MRLATIHHAGSDKVAVLVDDDTLLDITKAGGFTSMLTLIEAGPEALKRVRGLLADPQDDALINVADVTFRAPLPVPQQMRDCLVFEEHLINSFRQAGKMTGQTFDIPQVWYDQPIYYKCNRFSVVGHEHDIEWPSYSQSMDFECELAIVLGKGGKDIDARNGGDHIFGYTIFNDMSARDAQTKEIGAYLGPAKGKDFDTGNVLGPYLLTADEVPMDSEGRIALDMEAKVNGERWGGGNASAMHHTFGDILAHISQSETLHVGEVIGSGTVGTGCGLEIGRTLSDGDVMEMTIEKIGTLRNTIRKPSTGKGAA